MSDPEPTDAERYPALSAHGAAIMRFMREHPHAPIYRKASGHRLLPDDLPALRTFERWVRTTALSQSEQGLPRWLPAWLRRTVPQVPAYRRALGCGFDLEAYSTWPTWTRAELSADIATFVPDGMPLARLINFTTSGTSGHPLLVPSHPVVAARYRAFHERALARWGITLRAGRAQVGVVLIGWQQRCFTYVSVTPTRDDSGLAKINLHPDDWRDPADRARYLDALAAEVYAGDPLSFNALLELPTRHRPRALLSTSMALLPAMRARLEAHFGCPVLDLYSMNEAGPIAVGDPRLDAHVLLQPRLYVEILDAQGRPQPPGVRGEITLTGGFNFCLPLLRYRTGDYASLAYCGGDVLLRDLEGRPPVRYCRANGEVFNNVEVTHALKALQLPQWQLHQASDRSVSVRVRQGPGVQTHAVQAAVQALFGPGVPVTVQLSAELGRGDKVIQYTSAFAV